MIRILKTKKGWVLRVNGHFIRRPFFSEKILAIRGEFIPYGATEFCCVESLRKFWRDYRPQILEATKKPVKSQWGQLIPIN